MNTVKDALIKVRIRSCLIMHSDRGFQYQSIEYEKILASNEPALPCPKEELPLDNAPIESLFGTLKTECVYLEKLKTIEEAKEVIEIYIDFYNNHNFNQNTK